MRILPYGDRALLVELEPGADVIELRERLLGVAGIDALVPAARTLLVTFERGAISPESLRAALEAALEAAPGRAESTERTRSAAAVVLPVTYDGPDLAFAAEYTRLPEAEVIRRHAGGEYAVAFCGFAPGFAYLTGLDPALRLPRLDRPRASVPAGAVGVADSYTAAYPRASPGGWRLLGRTDIVLWDVARRDPALLTPGTRVRFVAS